MIDFAYVAHGVTLSLAWFVAVNLAVSILIVFAARLVLRRAAVSTPSAWLLLRLSPALMSALFVILLFVPSYWQYEPRESVEGFDLTLTTIAATGIALLVGSLVRGFLAWRSAARRVDDWMKHADPMTAGTTPCFVIDNDRAMVALSGIWRHRLFVSGPLLAALTGAELAAAVAHELGHRRAWDNLKRLAMRSAPDFLAWFSAAPYLERRWAAAAEHMADGAAGRCATTRCALASALVKVARLAPTAGNSLTTGPAPIAEPISTLIGGGEIASRVERLLEDSEPTPHEFKRYSPVVALVAAASILVMTYGPLVRLVHDATERLIRLLP
jgi:beta-lactamase regulating signal transducer with metallopeptidase domain